MGRHQLHHANICQNGKGRHACQTKAVASNALATTVSSHNGRAKNEVVRPAEWLMTAFDQVARWGSPGAQCTRSVDKNLRTAWHSDIYVKSCLSGNINERMMGFCETDSDEPYA